MSDRRCDQSSPCETNANGGRRAREGDPYATSPSCRTATTRRGGGEAAERESEQGDGVGEDEEAQELRRDVEVFVLFWNAIMPWSQTGIHSLVGASTTVLRAGVCASRS